MVNAPPPTPSEQQPARRRRWIAAAVLGAALALLGLRLALIQGRLCPVRVAGGSMAETLLGPHWPVTCRECGMPFRCGIEHPPPENRAICPNCGCRDNVVDATRIAPGQRVLIDRWAKLLHGLHAWQAVAFHAPHDADELTVKRIVAGGPGRVEIRDGDVYLDGQIQQKTLAQLREVRILVHDDRYRSPLANRWLPAQADTCWQPTRTGYTAQPVPGHGATIDWLHYTQWPCWYHGSPDVGRTDDLPILDHDPYNQSLTRGSLHSVPDLMLACQLQVSGVGHCLVRLTARRDVFEWELSAAGRECRLHWNGRCVAEAPRPAGSPPWTAEMAVWDHRVLAALDGTTIFTLDYEPTSDSPGAVDPHRLSIGTAGAHVQLEALRVYRDIYYLGPGNVTRWQAPQPMQVGQWFMLGDNVPVSVDSRFWSAIDGPAILGPVRKFAGAREDLGYIQQVPSEYNFDHEQTENPRIW